MTDRFNRWRYNLYAPIYDQLARVFTATRRRAIEALALQPRERVLIVGCGTGLDLDFIPRGVTIAGIDVAPGMLNRARRRAQRLGHEADLRLGDARSLPWADRSFDAVVLHFILAVAPEPERIARESARVLRPGGRVSVLDKFVSPGRRPSWMRRAANLMTRALFSDINRSLEPLLTAAGLAAVTDTKVGAGGVYRLVQAAKPAELRFEGRSMPSAEANDPDFWNQRYRAGPVPWDQHGVPMRFAEFLRGTPVTGRALVPGCGTGYEIRALHDAGWPVLGLDFCSAAIERAHALLGPLASLVRPGDFFHPSADPGVFHLVYERTFLCALPPALQPAYAARMAELIVPGGLLAGFFFHGPEDEPPPHPLPPAALAALLSPHFERIEDRSVPDSLPLYAGKERWQVWRRR